MKASLNHVKVTADSELIEGAHIYKQPILNLILAALLQPSFLGSEQNKPRINNDDVLKLAASRLSESVIERIIEVYESDFDITSAGLWSLRKNGIAERLIETMSKKCKAPASAISPMSQESPA
jgi:hypothetical protein